MSDRNLENLFNRVGALEQEVRELKTHRHHDTTTGERRGAALLEIQHELSEIRMMLNTQQIIRRVVLWIGGLAVAFWWAVKTGDMSRLLKRIFPG